MFKKLQLLALTPILIFNLFIGPSFSASGVIASVDSLFYPLGKTDNNDPRNVSFLYGVSGFTEIHENIRLSYGVRTSYYNGNIFTFPVSVAYVPTADYKFNLRPQIFAGIEPIYSNIPNFTGLKFYGHAGLALDYIFNNNWIINVSAKTYINESFFQTTPTANAFNSGIVSVSAGLGYKFQ